MSTHQMPLTAIRSAPSGANFVRADLHIHSFGPDGSPDVEDPLMTPEAIARTAAEKGLKIIAVTDHNRVGNVARAIEAGANAGILVVPGVELSTPGGHFLVYAETLDLLQRIIGRLTFDGTRDACRTSVHDILEVVEEFQGIAIAAHIDLESGFEQAIQGYGDSKASVIMSRTLVALEIARATAVDWYTDRDSAAPRKELLRRRLEAIGDPFVGLFPKIQSSDAHSLAALGKNFDRKDKLTRLKVTSLDWASFRRAFADPEARVRIEEEVPTSTPAFVGLRLRGGFLDGQTFAFSKNLTCIIGGRGSGKSTAFEALRHAAGRASTSDRVLSEAWPEQIDLVYRDEFGTETHLSVDSSGAINNESDPNEPIPEMAIESLGQGDTARTIEKCGKDPTALLSFIDELIDFSDAKKIAADARARLAVNGDTIATLSRELFSIENVTRQLEYKEKQENVATEEKGKELIALQQKLAAATAIRQQLVPAFETSVRALVQSITLEALVEFEETAAQAGALFDVSDNPLPELVRRTRASVSSARTALIEDLRKVEADLNAFVTAVQRRQHELSESVTKRVEELRAKGVLLDLKLLVALATEIQSLRKQLAVLKRKQGELVIAQKARRDLLREHRDARNRIFMIRTAFANQLTQHLRAMLVELDVNLQFRESRVSGAAEIALKDIMDWRTASVPKAPALVRSKGVPGVLDAIAKGDPQGLTAIVGPQDQPILTQGDATELLQRMAIFANVRRLEEAAYDDEPRLVVSRRQQGASDKGRVIQRQFAQLSLGQQQAIVLAILLSSDSKIPLLIDQPEDNLDSAFVFKVLVRALRRIKERRQVILVTHNANIGVLADSDLVIPLKATSEKGVVISPGSVEAEATRDLVCEILEGGLVAYERRGRLYAFSKRS